MVQLFKVFCFWVSAQFRVNLKLGMASPKGVLLSGLELTNLTWTRKYPGTRVPLPALLLIVFWALVGPHDLGRM